MSRDDSSGKLLKRRFRLLVQELSAQRFTVDEIADNKEVRGLFHQWKSPEKIIEQALKQEIRFAIQADVDEETGERNRVSVPDLPFPNVPSRTQFLEGAGEEQAEESEEEERPQRRGYDLEYEVKRDPHRWLVAIEEALRFIRAVVNKNKFLSLDEKAAILAGIDKAFQLAKRRLQDRGAA